MEEQDFQKAILNYVIHIADNQTRIAESQARIAEAMATLGAQSQEIARILEKVTQTTYRTEQMVAGILTRLESDKVSH